MVGVASVLYYGCACMDRGGLLVVLWYLVGGSTIFLTVPVSLATLFYSCIVLSICLYHMIPCSRRCITCLWILNRCGPGMTCACVDALGSHGRYKFSVCVDCSVFPYIRCMTRGRVAGLIFLSGAPGRIKFPVAPASTMAWLASIFILDVLIRVSCFGDSMLYMEELSISGFFRAVMSYLQLLWMIVLYSLLSYSLYKVLY